jgi:hypothetical protein
VAQACSALQFAPVRALHIGSPWQAPYEAQHFWAAQALQAVAPVGASQAGTQVPTTQSGVVPSRVQVYTSPLQLTAVEQRASGLPQPEGMLSREGQ